MKKITQNKDSRQLDAVYVDTTQDTNGKGSGRIVGDMTLDASWGKAVVCVDALGMSVLLRSIQRVGEGFSTECILKLLKEKGIVHGIHGGAIMEIGSRLKAVKQWRGEIKIATGTPAAKASFPKIPLLEKIGSLGVDGHVWSIGEIKVDFQKVQSVLNAEELDSVGASYPTAWMVRPNDVLIEFAEIVDGTGKDVFGNLVPVGMDDRFTAGDGVELDGDQLKASIWGVVILDGKTISVVPPISISPDKMTAFYLHFLNITPSDILSREQVVDALIQMGVGEETIDPALDVLIANLGSTEEVPFANVIAQGKDAVVGQDAYLMFEMDLDQKPGVIMPDGSIDLRERNLIHYVSAESLIVRKMPATNAEAGQNLFGDVLTVADGQDVAFAVGDGARLCEEDYEGQVVEAIYATIDGAVVFRAGCVSVNAVYRISGDVDYETGNVEFEEDIFISGSVKTGFEVRAGGNVIIGESIESGASVRANGSVTVGRGILGKTTRVVVMGELRAQFIQNAMVVVKGDLWCGRYIHNAQVRCGGQLKVPAGTGARSGSVVGGMICATKGIDVALAGSEAVPGTVLSIQADPEEQAKIEKLNNNLSVCDVQISKLTRSLGVASLNGEAIKLKMALLSGKQREHYVALLKKLKEVSGIRQKGACERDHLVAKNLRSLKDGNITVSKTIYARTEVKFGEMALVIEEDASVVTFELEGRAIMMQSPKKERGL